MKPGNRLTLTIQLDTALAMLFSFAHELDDANAPLGMPTRIRQIALVTTNSNLEATLQTLTRALDAPVVERDPGVAAFGLHNGILQLGDCFLEVVAPLPTINPVTTSGGRYTSKYGEGGYMVLVQVDNLTTVESSMSHLTSIHSGGRDGTTNQDRPHVPGQPLPTRPGITGTHYHPRDMGCIVEATSMLPAHEWLWAGKKWLDAPSGDSTKVGGFARLVIACQAPRKVCNTWRTGLLLSQKDPTATTLWTSDGTEITFRTPLHALENGIVEIDLWCRQKALKDCRTSICNVVFGFQWREEDAATRKLVAKL